MGFKRYFGGAADFLTGNRFDFDNRGRGDGPGNNQGNKKSIAPAERRRRGHPKFMGYPVARGQNERTGDSLLITCREYVAPKTGLDGEPAVFRTTSKGKLGGVDYGKNQIVANSSGAQAGQFTKTFVPGTMKLANRGASDMGGDPKAKDIFTVELPIPQDINDSNTVTWGDDNMNIFMLAGISAANMALGQPGLTFQRAQEFLTGGADLSAFGLDEPTQNAVRAAVTGKAIDVMGGQIRPNSAIGRASGMILNSNLELLFDSVNLRTFPFSINFSPRTPKESQMVKHIIRAFKSSMAAKKGIDEVGGQGGIFLRAPDVFKLRYLHNGEQHLFLNSFKDCALTGMTVNYTNAGTYTTYEDGTPVSIKMNLTFKELNPIYHEDYVDSGPGVGF